MPDDEARIGRGHEQAVVDLDLAREFLGEKRAHDEAEAPVDPACGQRDEAHQQDRAARAAGEAREFSEKLFHDRRRGHHVAGDQHQEHLHGEGQERPETIAPDLDHLQGRGALADNCGQRGHEGQHQHEDERVGQVTVHDADHRPGECVQHCYFPFRITFADEVTSARA